jgi:hypothetical protein
MIIAITIIISVYLIYASAIRDLSLIVLQLLSMVIIYISRQSGGARDPAASKPNAWATRPSLWVETTQITGYSQAGCASRPR